MLMLEKSTTTKENLQLETHDMYEKGENGWDCLLANKKIVNLKTIFLVYFCMLTPIPMHSYDVCQC
jgi:hypothetical protein